MTGGGAESGGAANGGVAGGGADNGGTTGNGDPVVGGVCTEPGTLACNGHMSRVPLMCVNGSWAAQAVCTATQYCNSESGLCADILEECADKAPGDSGCLGEEAYTCGPDLVTATRELCEGLCEAGRCEEPYCGDGKIEDGEECDDANDVGLDGCEPDCTSSRILQVVAGESFTCARLTGGVVRCWGGYYLEPAMLGLGDTTVESVLGDNEHPSTIPLVDVGGPVQSLAAGKTHVCAVLESGDVRCWGWNGSGQLGLGHTTNVGFAEAPSTVDTVALGQPARQVVAGDDFSCALLESGAVRCWGSGIDGQLGTGSTDNIGDDELVSAGANVPFMNGGTAIALAAGKTHVCALLGSGMVTCWGTGFVGELGRGSDIMTIGEAEGNTPADYDPLEFDGMVLSDVSVGEGHSCVSFESGEMRCWGTGTALGYESSTEETWASPMGQWFSHMAVAIGAPVTQIGAGRVHTCAVGQSGELYCWGDNMTGAVGYESVVSTGGIRNAITLDGVVTGIGLGLEHTCAILDETRLRCWGSCTSASFRGTYINGALGVPEACAGVFGSALGDDEDVLEVAEVQVF